MFAGFEAILTLGVAAGGLVTPLVVELLGVRPALVAIGLLAPLAVAASWPALRRLDAEVRVRDADIETMRPIRMLGALPVATIEQLAGGLEHADFEPGHTVFQQGERGEYFYIVRVRSRGGDPRWTRRQDARRRRLLRRDRTVARPAANGHRVARRRTHTCA